MYQKKKCIKLILLALLLILLWEWMKKNCPQVYLEKCKYKIKKMQMSRFINTELELDSESDDELKFNSDDDSDHDSE